MSIGKKKEDIFFTLFKDFSAELSIMGKEFGNICSSFASDKKSADIMKDFESRCDSKKHIIINQLNDSFITPFDREDIFAIAGLLDDIADYIEDIVCKFGLFNVNTIREDALQLVEIIMKITNQISMLFIALPESKKGYEVKEAIISLNDLEDQGDIIYRNSLARLFREESDPIEIIKWKEIYELLEDTIDAGEHLADTVEGIMSKNA